MKLKGLLLDFMKFWRLSFFLNRAHITEVGAWTEKYRAIIIHGDAKIRQMEQEVERLESDRVFRDGKLEQWNKHLQSTLTFVPFLKLLLFLEGKSML